MYCWFPISCCPVGFYSVQGQRTPHWVFDRQPNALEVTVGCLKVLHVLAKAQASGRVCVRHLAKQPLTGASFLLSLFGSDSLWDMPAATVLASATYAVGLWLQRVRLASAAVTVTPAHALEGWGCRQPIFCMSSRKQVQTRGFATTQMVRTWTHLTPEQRVNPRTNSYIDHTSRTSH